MPFGFLLSPVERVRFQATTQAPAASGRVIMGLALPFGVQASASHPAFPKGVLVEPGLPKPLLLEHDFRKVVGEVKHVWEGQDGIYFLATLSAPLESVPKQLSVGGEYIAEGDTITALYITEISLTNSPAYTETKYTIMATDTEKLAQLEAEIQKLRAENASLQRRLKAQEEGMTDPIAAIEAKLAQHEERLTALEQRVMTLEETIMQMQAQAVEAMKAAQTAKDELKKILAQASELVDGKLADYESVAAKRFDILLDNLQKLIRK